MNGKNYAETVRKLHIGNIWDLLKTLIENVLLVHTKILIKVANICFFIDRALFSTAAIKQRINAKMVRQISDLLVVH